MDPVSAKRGLIAASTYTYSSACISPLKVRRKLCHGELTFFQVLGNVVPDSYVVPRPLAHATA